MPIPAKFSTGHRKKHLRRVTPALFGIVAAVAVVTPPISAGAGPRQICYEGTLELQGDYRRPGETHRLSSEQRYYTDGGDRTRLDWITWTEGDSARAPESFLVAADSVFHRDAPTASWQLLAGERARLGRFQAMAGLRTENLIERHAHPRLGDTQDSVVFAPGTMLEVLHERDTQWRMTQRLIDSNSTTPPESLLASPATFTLPRLDRDSVTAEPVIVSLAPGVWCAEMEDIGSRTLIVEFADHLAIAEFAVGSKNGERIVDAARRRWPAKPIRYALFSHHHPHYLGGVRAFIAEGAMVVTTPGNEAVVRALATRPFTMEPDRLAQSPKPVSVKTFSERIEFADASNQLIAFDYGARSSHTDEMVVFYLPRARLLFESGLGWVRQQDGSLRAGRSAATLIDWFAEQHLDVDRIVQGWPMRDNDREVSRVRLAELVASVKR
jgi:glyoxylase-like metal-dependent hydrolase (beta-lactamase superfamily II)